MKKKAFLLIVLCASILNAQNGPEFAGIGGLPIELQIKIILELNAANTIEDAVTAIKNNKNLKIADKELYAIMNDMYGNEKEFTIVLNTLARRFVVSPNKIARLFGTETSEKYLRIQSLSKQLVKAIEEGNTNLVSKLINDGADVNYIIQHATEQWTPLTIAVMKDKADIVQILLQNGANPHFINGRDIMTGRGLKAEAKAIDYLYFNRDMSPQAVQQKVKIKKLLEDAMNKNQ